MTQNVEAIYNTLHEIHQLHDYSLSAKDLDAFITGPWHTNLKQHLESVAGKDVLEIACGQGPFSLWLHQQGATIWAADFATEAVEQTRKLFIHNGFSEKKAQQQIIQADLQQLPFADNQFDILISCETLEHLPNPEAGLKEVFRVLKPGGRFYLTTENYLNVTGLYRLYKEHVCHEQWRSGTVTQPIEQFFTAPALLKTMRQTGFHIPHWDSSGYYFYFPKQPQPLDLAFLSTPGLHRGLTKYMGRHLFVLAEVNK